MGLWAWTVTRGGRLSPDLERFSLAVDFSGLVHLLLPAAALKGLHHGAEPLSHRKERLLSRTAAPPARSGA